MLDFRRVSRTCLTILMFAVLNHPLYASRLMTERNWGPFSGFSTIVALLFLGVLVFWIGWMVRERLVALPMRAVAKSEEGFRTLFEKSPLGITVWELQGSALQCNKAFLEMVGYSDDEMDMINYQNLSLGDTTEADRNSLKQLVATGRFGPHQKKYRHKSGREVPVTIYGMLVTDALGVKRIWSIVEDMTEQKRMESQIQQSQRRLNLALESGRIGTWELEPATGVMTWDKVAGELVGLDPEGRGFEDIIPLVHPDDRPMLEESIRLAVEHGDFELEYRISHNEGNERVLRSRAHAFMEDGRPLLIGTTWDVTNDRDTAEALIESKVAAEAAVRAKSDFLATMSHEIRTPLNGIMGMSELLLNANLEPHRHANVETILSCGKELLGIINDILDFSQMEQENLVLETGAFRPGDIPAELLQKVQQKAQQKSLAIEIDCEDNLPTVVGDYGRLNQALLNILDNAVKFTSEGKVVFRVEKWDRGPGEVELMFTISDTGIGIPPEFIPKMFSPFTQVDSSSTRSYGGTGLGLTIARSLVDGMGGKIRVDSTLGKGSTFEVRFPFKVMTALEVQNAPEVAGAGGRGKVLVALGDGDAFKQIALGLSDYDIHAQRCEDAFQALRILRHHNGEPYLGVVASENQAQLSALDLARIMTSDPQLDASRLVILCDHNDPSVQRQAQSLGVAGVLEGSFHKQSLAAMLLGEALPATPLVRSKSNREDWKILVVDDDDVRRGELMKLLLNLGVHGEPAGSAGEAFAFLKIRDYDLVLMECNLKELDGLSAARLLREMGEAGDLAGTCPLVALGVDEMGGLEETCKHVGMADLVRRPIDPKLLAQTLNTWLSAEK